MEEHEATRKICDKLSLIPKTPLYTARAGLCFWIFSVFAIFFLKVTQFHTFYFVFLPIVLAAQTSELIEFL